MPVILVFAKLAGARTLLADGDTGWHIRTGEWILANHRVPHTDLFSFSRPGAPWFAWEWLWDAALRHAAPALGDGRRGAGQPGGNLPRQRALFRLIRRKCENGLVAIAVTLLATGGCAIHWLARPHLFTFFLPDRHTAYHRPGRRWRGRAGALVCSAWLIPLTLLWTNVHGGFFVIFLVLACYIGSDLLNAAIEADPGCRRASFSAGSGLGAPLSPPVPAVTLINPYGWQLHKHVIDYISDPYQLQHIAEFEALDFHSPAVVYFEPLMIWASLTRSGTRGIAGSRMFFSPSAGCIWR